MLPKFIRPLFFNLLEKRKIGMICYTHPYYSKVWELYKNIPKERREVFSHLSAFTIAHLVLGTTHLKEDIVEAGVFRGASAKIICEFKGNKKLHLFDTFEGLPTSNFEKEDARYFEGRFYSNVEDVKKYLEKYPDVFFHKGLLEKNMNKVKSKRFSLVHMDMDLYEPTKVGLNFFFPRLVKGGAILIHDYVVSTGVRKACDDFLKKHPSTSLVLESNHIAIFKSK